MLYHDRKDLMRLSHNCSLKISPTQGLLDKVTSWNMLRQNNDMDRHRDRFDITLGHGATQHRQRYNTPVPQHDQKDLMSNCQICGVDLPKMRLSSSDKPIGYLNMSQQNNGMDRHKDRLDVTVGHGATQHRQRYNTPVPQHDRKDLMRLCHNCGLLILPTQMSSDKITCWNMLQQNNDMDRHKDRFDITLGHGATQHCQRYNTPVPQRVCKDGCLICGVDLPKMRLSSSDEPIGYLNMSQQNNGMDRHKDRFDVTLGHGATQHRQRYNTPVPQHVCKDDQVVLDVQLPMQDFEPEKIEMEIVDNYIVVTAKHENKRDEHDWESHQFVRRFQLPKNLNIGQLACKLSNGRLTIVGPKIQPLKDETEKTVKIQFIRQPSINKKQENPKKIQQSEEKEKPE